jgi:hypothetical protein
MCNAAVMVGEAVGTITNVNIDSQTSTAMEALFLMGGAFPLSEAWSKQLTEDQEKDFRDNLMIATDSAMAAQAAADYEQYTMDSNQMDMETGNQNNLLQKEKSQVRSLGNSMDQIYNLEEPIGELGRGIVSAILRFN